MALAGDVTHFALGLDLLPLLHVGDGTEGGGSEAGGGGAPRTGPLEDGEKEGSGATAVDVTEGGAARQQGELESVAVTWLACDCEGGDGMLSGVIDLLRGQRGSLVN